MAVFIPSRPTRLTQPIGRSELDASHPLARYAVAAWAGQRDSVDAMGNAMRWVGPGIEQRVGKDGFEQYQTGANNSLGLWVDKSIGQFGTDDFFIQVRITSGAPSSSRAFLGKGDTGASEWMFGSGGAASSHRFYAAGGAISVQTDSGSIVQGRTQTVAASRVGGVLNIYIDGVAYGFPDSSASNSLSDATHHLTIGGADYDGTTFDNTRIYVGGLSQVILLRGIGGADVASAFYAQPWRIFRPVERRIIVSLSGGGGSEAGNASGLLSSITTSAASAGASGAAQSAAACAILSVTPAEASASGGVSVVGNASASLASLSLSAASASASGSAAASAALVGISIAPASAVASGGASVPATASASLASLSTAPATATASGAATAAGAMLGMNLTPAQAQATAAAWAAAELRALSISPATATAGDGSAAPWPTGRADPQHLAVVPFAGVRAMVPAADLRAAVPFTGVRAIVQQDTP